MSNVADGPKLAGLGYKVVRSLGNGAGSTILLIQDTDLGNRYALKVVKRQDAGDDIYINQALHEFEVARRLSHPSILKIHDCRTKRAWFRVSGVELLMEYVEGRTLDELMVAPLDQFVLMFIHIASALSHMHRRGVYHGDLKPSNLMLSQNAVVKVIDFGTAWIKGQPKDRVQGTPQYMAPEQATERVVNERTDLYNFGATMYRLLTRQYANPGGVPQIGDGAFGRKGGRGLVQPPIELNPEVPGTLNEIILSCLETSPDRRPSGAAEVKRQLVAVARHLGLSPENLRGSEESCG